MVAIPGRRPSSRFPASGTRTLAIVAALACAGCLGRTLRESELPSSHRNSTLTDFRPPEILDHLSEWFPNDWRVHLLRGLTDTTRAGRLSALRKADSLRTDDPLPAYFLALHYLDISDAGATPDTGAESQARLPAVRSHVARQYVEKALALDPGNGVLKVMLAYVLLGEGRLPKARALFMDPRRVPTGTSYQDRLEEVVLGLFSHAGQLNPYTLAEAAALYRSLPMPPFEKMADILYSVFLSTQADRPYDIRIRGLDAARGVFELGRQLRVASYGGHQLLSDGYEQRALGFMFQVRAAQFLTLFHQAFEDVPLSARSLEELQDVQMEYQDFVARGAAADTLVSDYLDRWAGRLRDHGSLSVGEAAGMARQWPLWRQARFFRYPAADDR